MKMILTITLLIISSTAHPYFTRRNEGRYATNITKINPSPRCWAMSEACSSIIDDASSIDINPALLINTKKTSLFLSHTHYFEDISMKSMFFAKNLGKNTGTFGFGIKKLDWGRIEKTDELANPLGSYSPYEMSITAGFASYLYGLTKGKTQRIVFGGSGKVVINKVEKTAFTLTSDIGFIFPYLFDDKLILSFTIQNILGSIKMDKESYPIAKSIKIGSSILISKTFIINTDIIAREDSIPYISSGVEVGIKLSKRNYLYLRGGITSKNINAIDEYSPISLGLGLRYGSFFLDYSLSQMGYLGSVDRISISLRY